MAEDTRDGVAVHSTAEAELPHGLRQRYQVHGLIGEGRSKRVYRVHDSRLDRDVALALIKAPGIRGDALERTVREAQALGRLSAHPHIVTVHDGGEEDGQPYLVTEYMPGGDLAQVLESAPEHRLPVGRALEVGTSLAE